MPFQPLFVTYQHDFRFVVTDRGLKFEWDEKSKAQKAAWKAAYDVVRAREEAVNAHELGPTGLIQRHTDFHHDLNAGHLNINNQASYDHFLRRVDILRQDYVECAALHLQVADAYQELHRVATIQHEQPASIQHAAQELQLATQRSTDAEQERRELGLERNDPPVVLDPVGRRRMPAQWVGDDVDNRNFRDAVMDHVSNDQYLDTKTRRANRTGAEPMIWVPQEKLGGGLSMGYVWVLVDQANRIRDRAVRKDVHLPKLLWTNPAFWDDSFFQVSQRLAREQEITDAMYNVRDLNHTVQLRVRPRPADVYQTNLSYRLYMQYASYGDLESLIENHIRSVPPQRIPEPFIWYVAEALALAGKAMTYGDLYGQADDWKHIIHRDLKPSNVFLAESQRDFYPWYPTPRLGDYGISIRTSPNDEFNPKFYRLSGTRQFLAPEQREFIDRVNLTILDDYRLQPLTNVYGVGLILRCLLTNTFQPPEPLYLGNPHNNTDLNINDPAGHYSAEIKDLVRRCLRFDLVQRISFGQMLTYIDHHAHTRNLSQGMQDNSLGHAAAQQYMPVLGQPKYAIGMIRPAPTL